jgi:hypothetical protein
MKKNKNKKTTNITKQYRIKLVEKKGHNGNKCKRDRNSQPEFCYY